MKPISIKAQRIIALVPGLNLLCLPIFIYNSFLAKFTLKDYLRSWIYFVFPAAFVVILCKIIIYYLPTIGVAFSYICTYVSLLVVGLRLTEYQERYL